MSPRCILCDRTFDSDEALQQHKQDSPAHAFDCTTCDRHFGGDMALEQHLRHSPFNASFFDCDVSDQSFKSEDALEQHLRDSPAHSLSFDCDPCDRSFGSEKALKQHLRDSTVKRFWSSICSTRPCTLNLSIVKIVADMDMLDVACVIAPSRREGTKSGSCGAAWKQY